MNQIQFIVTLVISILASAATSKACATRWNGNFGKICTVGCLLTALATIYSMLLHGLGIYNVQTIFLCCTFMYASYGDIKTHEADDFIHIIVLAVALMTKPVEDIPAALLSAVILGGILLLVAVFVNGAGIGGADIRFTAACAFLSTLYGGLIGLGLGTFAALLFNSPFRKKGAEKGFPMLPYLSCSYMIVYLLSNTALN